MRALAPNISSISTSNRGFSLLELLAVVTILGIIAALIVPRVTSSSAASAEKACYHNRATINRQVELFYNFEGAWPANNLSDIGADIDYFPQGVPMCPVDGQPYVLDATTHRVVGHSNSGDH